MIQQSVRVTAPVKTTQGRKPRVAVLHAAFLGGGAEAVCLWTIQALTESCDVSLITLTDVDFDYLNGYYGTDLSADAVSVFTPLPRFVRRRLASSLSLFSVRQYVLSRYYKSVAHQFDIGLSTFNELDMGPHLGAQYVHYPLFSSAAQRVRSVVGYPVSRHRRIADQIAKRILGYDDTALRSNVWLTNSHWTSAVLQDVYGVAPQVLYPPVLAAYTCGPWSSRANEFVCLSRLVEDKQVDRAVSIIEAVRARGYDVRLRLIGGRRADGHRRFVERLITMQRRHSDWITIEFDLSKALLTRRLHHARFGLHVRENEQFGIAVAEMAGAGCIPFVPYNGGAREILNGYSFLTFRDEADAVDRICAVLEEPGSHERLSEELAAHATSFSAARFMSEMRSLVFSLVCREPASRRRPVATGTD